MALLFDKHPIVLDKGMATIIGLNEAIVLQQVHYWLELNKKEGKNYHEGRYWTYNTYDEWHEQFPFWSKETIKRVFKRLRKMKLIIVDRFNVYQMDRTLWYTIDYDRLKSIMKGSKDSDRGRQNGPIDSRQNTPLDKVNLCPPIPENTTEISTETISPSVNGEYCAHDLKARENPSMGNSNSQNKTEGQMDNPSDTKLDARKIVAKCDLENITESYRDAVFKAILLLVQEINNYENIKIGNIYVPKDIAKAEMEKLDFFVIEHAIEKFKEATKTIKTKNPINYLKSCIYNAISEINIDIDAEVRYEMERDMYSGGK